MKAKRNPAQPMAFGGKYFPSKEAALKHVRKLKDLYLNKPKLSDEHAAEIVSLIERYHPHAAEKIGNGVDRVTVELSDWKAAAIFFYRTDGTREDVSFNKCFSKPTHNQVADAAMRNAVRDQVIRFKVANYQGRCEYTNERIDIRDVEVDHIPPRMFARLRDEFLRLNGITLADIEVCSSDSGVQMADVGWQFWWEAFHHKHARLRIVSRHANRRLITQDAKTAGTWRASDDEYKNWPK